MMPAERAVVTNNVETCHIHVKWASRISWRSCDRTFSRRTYEAISCFRERHGQDVRLRAGPRMLVISNNGA